LYLDEKDIVRKGIFIFFLLIAGVLFFNLYNNYERMDRILANIEKDFGSEIDYVKINQLSHTIIVKDKNNNYYDYNIDLATKEVVSKEKIKGVKENNHIPYINMLSYIIVVNVFYQLLYYFVKNYKGLGVDIVVEWVVMVIVSACFILLGCKNIEYVGKEFSFGSLLKGLYSISIWFLILAILFSMVNHLGKYRFSLLLLIYTIFIEINLYLYVWLS